MRLRIDVFIVEQSCSYPELDGRDLEDGTRHVWMADDLGVVAYLRVLDDDGDIRISRVATRNDARSGGFAGALLDHVLDTSDGPWVLDAPTGLAGWYRKRNFTDDGDEFVEDGILTQRCAGRLNPAQTTRPCRPARNDVSRRSGSPGPGQFAGEPAHLAQQQPARNGANGHRSCAGGHHDPPPEMHSFDDRFDEVGLVGVDDGCGIRTPHNHPIWPIDHIGVTKDSRR